MSDDNSRNDRFLDKAYELGGSEETVGFYDDWAKTYDAEIGENGYRTPGRCAEALKALDPSLAAPVIDLGCGTGLGGLALRKAGFAPVDGVDFSPGMLAEAKTLGCYRHLWTADLSKPLYDQIPKPDTPYAHAIAAGVLNPGHAPASAILPIVDMLPSGGLFVFSLNDHALADSSYEARINDVVDGGWASVAFKDYGEHLPGAGIKAMVYGLQRY